MNTIALQIKPLLTRWDQATVCRSTSRIPACAGAGRI